MSSRPLTFGSVCSGMEAASLAWGPLGWKCAFVSEIDKAPSALLAQRFPDVPNFGDMTKFEEWPDVAIDLLAGGTPCQSFSVAGMRKGLADPRGSLMLVYGAIAARYRPTWLVWENVPGVLSDDEGQSFGSFLGLLSGQSIKPPANGWQNSGIIAPGTPDAYGLAYAVLDAQYFGVAQRRARVFVVGYLGDWRPPLAVLLEPESLRGDSPPRREAQQGIAGTIAGGARGRGGYSDDDIPHVARALTAHPARIDGESETFITHALTGEGFDASEDGTGRGTPLVPVAYGIDSDCFDRSGEGSAADAGSRSGLGIQAELSSVVRAKRPNAVAYNITPSQSDPNSHVVQTRSMVGFMHASEPEADTVEALRTLREDVGEEAFAQWGLGVLAALLPSQILQPSLHGLGVRRPTEPKRGLVNVALSRSKAGAVWSVRDLWEAGCDGCPPQGWRPHEQCARKLGAHLSKLPHRTSSAQGFMHGLRIAGEGSRLLREALSAVEEVWRRPADEGQSAHASWAVRRLTARECEALQGAPLGYTEITYRGKPIADGPRYKMIGNSWAVPVVRWIGERIDLVRSEMGRAA